MKSTERLLAEELRKRFPRVSIMDMELIVSCRRGELDTGGPWIVFFRYPSGDHAGVSCFGTQEAMVDSFAELTEEIGADILAIYNYETPMDFSKTVRWMFTEGKVPAPV